MRYIKGKNMNDKIRKIFKIFSNENLSSLNGRMILGEEWEKIKENNDFLKQELFLYGVFVGFKYIVLSLSDTESNFSVLCSDFNVVETISLNSIDDFSVIENRVENLKEEIIKVNEVFNRTFFEKFAEGFRKNKSMTQSCSLNSFTVFGIGFNVEIKRNEFNEFIINAYILLRNNENKLIFSEKYVNDNNYFFEKLLESFLLIVSNCSCFTLAYKKSCLILLELGFENVECFDIKLLEIEKENKIFKKSSIKLFYHGNPNANIVFDYINDEIYINKNDCRIYNGKIFLSNIVEDEKEKFKKVFKLTF